MLIFNFIDTQHNLKHENLKLQRVNQRIYQFQTFIIHKFTNKTNKTDTKFY